MSLQNFDLVCFSHLRWNFVYQRPQHLLSRFAKEMRVFFIEEPIFSDDAESLQITHPENNLWVIIPLLQNGLSEEEINFKRKNLLSKVFADMEVNNYIFWYYTPMSLLFSNHFNPKLIIYDCMDELSAFKFAPKGLKESENDLFKTADLVFTGGHSLYEAKKHRHRHIYPFPSSIDKNHFQQARFTTSDPPDQSDIPHARFGFYGVIDERMDLSLIEEVAKQRPAWHFVIIGPVVKIEPETLPRLDNIHYLGSKSYQELPSYLGGWDIALIPFALNDSTRFISPTKTPEYLSAGIPVISSSIQDVVNPYGSNNLVHIADTTEDFIRVAEMELQVSNRQSWLKKVDAFLQENSWDNTWSQMILLINDKLADKAQDNKNYNLKLKENFYV